MSNRCIASLAIDLVEGPNILARDASVFKLLLMNRRTIISLVLAVIAIGLFPFAIIHLESTPEATIVSGISQDQFGHYWITNNKTKTHAANCDHNSHQKQAY